MMTLDHTKVLDWITKDYESLGVLEKRRQGNVPCVEW